MTASYIEIYQPGNIKYPSNGFLLHPLFTALPIQPLTIKDARTITANFYFDTGAGLCFLMSKQFEDDSAVLKNTESLYLYRSRDLEVKSRCYSLL